MKFKIFLAAVLISILFSTSFASSERVNSMGKAIWFIDDLIYDLDLNPAFATSQKSYLFNSSFFYYKKRITRAVSYIHWVPHQVYHQSYDVKEDSMEINFITCIPLKNHFTLTLAGEFSKIDRSVHYFPIKSKEERFLESTNKLYNIRTGIAYEFTSNLSIGIDFSFLKVPWIDFFNAKEWHFSSDSPLNIDQVDGKKLSVGIRKKLNQIEYGFSLSYMWQDQIYSSSDFFDVKTEEQFRIFQPISHLKYQISRWSYLRSYLSVVVEKFQLERSYYIKERIERHTNFPSLLWGIGLVNTKGGTSVVFGLSGTYFKNEVDKTSVLDHRYNEVGLSMHWGLEQIIIERIKLRGGIRAWSKSKERDGIDIIVIRGNAWQPGTYYYEESNVLQPGFLTLGIGIEILENIIVDIDVSNIPKSSDSMAESFLRISSSFTY